MFKVFIFFFNVHAVNILKHFFMNTIFFSIYIYFLYIATGK